MRFWAYIKSRNKTVLLSAISVIAGILLIILLFGNSLFTNEDNRKQTNDPISKENKYLTSTSTVDIQGYTIEFLHKYYSEGEPIDSWDNVRVLKNEKVLFETDLMGKFLSDADGWIENADDIKTKAIKDITGNNIPELILLDYSGGSHCCSHNYIVELSDPPSVLLDLETGNRFITFKDLNHDKIMEIETYEDVFTYWYTSYAGSPMPRVVLSIQDGVYKADPIFMRKLAPTDKAIQKNANAIKSWSSAAGPDVAWKYAIDLIYSGNIKSAIKYVDLAWRDDEPGDFRAKENFWRELVDQIVNSPYFLDLSSYLGFDDMVDAGVKQVCDNHKDIQNFEKPIPIVWTAKLDGCLMSCYGASFTRIPSDEKYPRFAGYYPDTSGKYNWDIDTNGNDGGSRIPEKFKKVGQILKVYGKWTSVEADHPYTVFENKCVPLVEIDKLEILNIGSTTTQTRENLCKSIKFTKPLEQEVKYNEEISQNNFIKYLRRSIDDFLNKEYENENKCSGYSGLYNGVHCADSVYDSDLEQVLSTEGTDVLRGKIIILQTDIAPGGGMSVIFMFKNKPDKIYYAWVYGKGKEDGYYDLRAIHEYTGEGDSPSVFETQRVFINQICDEQMGI